MDPRGSDVDVCAELFNIVLSKATGAGDAGRNWSDVNAVRNSMKVKMEPTKMEKKKVVGYFCCCHHNSRDPP